MEKKDRVQGVVGAADRWAKVSPKAVVAGSSAQAENVLADAIHDIGCLWRACLSSADTIERLTRELSEARVTVLEEAAKVADAMPILRSVSTAHVKSNTPKDVAAAIRALKDAKP